MSRWLARAAKTSANAPSTATDITDESSGQTGDPELLSVVSVRCLDAFQPTNGLVSVLAVPLQEPFEESPSIVTVEWYSRGWVWSEIETQTFLVRQAQFRASGLPDPLAEKLADQLVARDRNGDDRGLCAECRHCRPGPRCTKQLAVLDVLHRCDYFATKKP